MKFFLFFSVLVLTGCQPNPHTTGRGLAYLRSLEEAGTYEHEQNLDAWLSSDNSSVIEADGYGLGVHKNRYGEPVWLSPDFGGVYGERLQIQTDGYGHGVHVDQYGRPVREYPWP